MDTKKIALESMVCTGISGYKNNCTGESMVTRKQALLFMMERMSKNRNEPVPTELPTSTTEKLLFHFREVVNTKYQ